ncbi:hypothetical protein Tco_0998127 [Tanacetum coccineum]
MEMITEYDVLGTGVLHGGSMILLWLNESAIQRTELADNASIRSADEIAIQSASLNPGTAYHLGNCIPQKCWVSCGENYRWEKKTVEEIEKIFVVWCGVRVVIFEAFCRWGRNEALKLSLATVSDILDSSNLRLMDSTINMFLVVENIL